MFKSKFISTFTVIIMFSILLMPVFSSEFADNLECKSAILMEASTGRVLYEKNADDALPPASVTKIMTLLLVMEAVDSGRIKLTDMVTTSENAASMGGSQVYLKVGEEMSVEDMIKCVVIASANDCAVALAEFICGSEEVFVGEMNKRAKELGMNNTNFENTNGLDDTVTKHVTSARDIAIMSRELLKHKLILKYSSTWMDTIRDGSFGLTNTNRLVRFYSGANGLKTGSTAKAKFCISATAKRDGMQLIAVIMAAPTRDIRNNEAKQLFDFGFMSYGLYNMPEGETDPIPVAGGVIDSCKLEYKEINLVLEKEKISKLNQRFELPETVTAPISKNDIIGKVILEYNGEEIASTDIYAGENIEKIKYAGLLKRVVKGFFLG
ncbi:MAG: D-alanyl-D-alanine carboxypeptidase [Clostridia bacterium]|nr:D-alanyl-D-alanine carboxypeptidase [Clostridia bacterium]